MGFIKITGLFSHGWVHIGFKGELTNKSARILRESYLKVGGDGTTLKYSWGDAP